MLSNLRRKNREGSVAVSIPFGGATTVGDDLLCLVDHFNDVEMTFLEVGVQGNEPFCVGLNAHRVAICDFRLGL